MVWRSEERVPLCQPSTRHAVGMVCGVKIFFDVSIIINYNTASNSCTGGAVPRAIIGGASYFGEEEVRSLSRALYLICFSVSLSSPNPLHIPADPAGACVRQTTSNK